MNCFAQVALLDMKKTAYHYPTYTEKELLEKFNMAVTKGYYQHRKFYEPDYDTARRDVADNRNTLAWNPAIITDENGEATIQFFCGDIPGRFTGVIEGAGGEGLPGAIEFNFSVHQ